MKNPPSQLLISAKSLRQPNCRMGGEGFSLLELLVVIGFLGLMASLVLPAVAGFGGRGGELRKATATIAGLLEEARQYAVAHNTFVYVALTSSQEGAGEAANVAVVITARDGGHLFTPERNELDLRVAEDTERVEILRMARNLRWVQLAADRTMLADQTFAPQLSVNRLENGHRVVDADGRELSGIIQFGPTGEASEVRGDAASSLEVVVVDPRRPEDGRVIQVFGITGLLHVFAP